MTYYSGHDFLAVSFWLSAIGSQLIAKSQPLTASGPRGIRTLDLLNAIETRSQLRYGPLFCYQVTRMQLQWT